MGKQHPMHNQQKEAGRKGGLVSQSNRRLRLQAEAAAKGPPDMARLKNVVYDDQVLAEESAAAE